MQEKIDRLQVAVEASIKRRSRKRRYVRTEERSMSGEVADLVTATAGDSRNNRSRLSKSVRTERHCRHCLRSV
jgi:hypothetical protein